MAVEAQEKCEVVTEPVEELPETGIPLSFAIPCCIKDASDNCVGSSFVAYESVFQSTRVTGTLFVRVFPSNCIFTVTAERADQEPITETIFPTDDNRFINLVVDCLIKLTFSCTPAQTSGEDSRCEGQYTLQLQWCKCC